jgi:hypothetical protein
MRLLDTLVSRVAYLLLVFLGTSQPQPMSQLEWRLMKRYYESKRRRQA